MIDVEHIKEQLKNSVGSEIYNHCISTMEEAEKLAVFYRIDVEKAKIAGLLHDCGKAKKNEMANDSLSHSKTGAELAKKLYNIDDIDILDAIRYHTTGREAMTPLEKIVYIADKIEPNRKYEGIDEIRLLAYENINYAIIKSIMSTIYYVKKRNMSVNEESEKTLNFLLKGGNNI